MEALGKRRRLGVLFAVAAAALAIVVVRRVEPGAEPLHLNYASLVTATPAPTPVVVGALPGGASPHSALVMVQGIVERKLVVWPLAEGGAPREVDRNVKPWPLVPDPGGTRVIYRTINALMVLDVPARRAQIVADLPGASVIRAVQWSPDGDALAYVVASGTEQIAYYAVPGSGEAEVAMLRAPAGLPMDVAWLEDGRPVVVTIGIGPVGGLEAHYQLYDPATDERLMLPPDVTLLQPRAPWRSPDGQHQLYTLASGATLQSSGGCRTGGLGLANADWVYLAVTGSGEERQVAFELRDVVFDLVTWLPDGRVLMRGIADEGCAPGATGIYVARLGEQPRQLIPTGPFLAKDDDDVVWGATFDLSPDRMLIAWVKNDAAAQQAGIYLTPVDGGEAARFFTAPPPESAAPFAFEDTTAILDFIWLP